MTPSLEAFAQLPLWDFEASWAFIQGHREVVVNGASDALLLAAFRNQTDGKTKLAKQCVHQSLLLQYGDKLGADGLRLFFQRCVALSRVSKFAFSSRLRRFAEARMLIIWPSCCAG